MDVHKLKQMRLFLRGHSTSRELNPGDASKLVTRKSSGKMDRMGMDT